MSSDDPQADGIDDQLVTDVRMEGATLTLGLPAQLTLEHATDLRQQLMEVLEAHPKAETAALDLTAVEQISSAALGVLVVFCKAFGCERGRMALAVSRPEVRRLIRMTGLDTIFTLAEDMPAALKVLGNDSAAAGGAVA